MKLGEQVGQAHEKNDRKMVDNSLKTKLADGFEYFHAVAFDVFDILNAAPRFQDFLAVRHLYLAGP
jgi:hypothetical protein